MFHDKSFSTGMQRKYCSQDAKFHWKRNYWLAKHDRVACVEYNVKLQEAAAKNSQHPKNPVTKITKYVDENEMREIQVTTKKEPFS